MLTHLGEITTEQFLQEYWQKKPLLIRQLFDGFDCPFDENDLAGLAMEEDVESRLVFTSLEGKPWQVQHGPFSSGELESLPTEDWTLLIQGVDSWCQELSWILDAFRFLPNWRLDDIMASFAPKGGSVGPHYDNYDVFLVQAMGHRNWQVGQQCDERSASLKGTPLRILADMQTTDEWVLEPGDALYLPPGIAHYGIAQDHCITLSVGFRSPTFHELISSWAAEWLDSPLLDKHLKDPTSAPTANPGLIDQKVFDQFESFLENLQNQKNATRSWLTSYLTQPKNQATVQSIPEDEQMTEEALSELLQDTTLSLHWNEGSRFCYSLDESADQVIFSADGSAWGLLRTHEPLIQELCVSSDVRLDRLRPLIDKDSLPILAELINQGSLHLIEDSTL